MKQNQKGWKMRAASVGLAVVCLCGGAMAAGDEDDPLISLSYLTKTVIPDILEQVEEKAEQYQTELLKEFNKAIDQYKGEVRQEQEKEATSATYETVVLSEGQKLGISSGGEVLLRSGSVTVSTTAVSALVDMSGGVAVGEGGILETNHLYVATVSDCVVTAGSAEVILLVRGACQTLE